MTSFHKHKTLLNHKPPAATTDIVPMLQKTTHLHSTACMPSFFCHAAEFNWQQIDKNKFS